MTIGNSPDLPEYDKEREREQRLLDECWAWWDSLTEQEQCDLMLDWYPNEFNKDDYDNGDSFFGDMPSECQIEIWQSETNPAVDLSEEEIDSIIADREFEERREGEW